MGFLGSMRRGQVGDLACKHGISEVTLYNWKVKYGGLEVSEARRLKAGDDCAVHDDRCKNRATISATSSEAVSSAK